MAAQYRTDISVEELEIILQPQTARTPLKFGGVVVESVPFCRIRAVVENGDHEVAEGWGGIFLMDQWGWPDPAVSHEDKQRVMQRVLDDYVHLVMTHPGTFHPIELFIALEGDLARINERVCAEEGVAVPQPFLGALVCASPVDAALHDAFGNVNGIDSYRGYGPEFMDDLSGFLGPDFVGQYVEHFIRPAYKPKVPVFHLVGGLDKLTRDELDGTDPDDGLPSCLADWIAFEGMYCLKVKLRGNDLDWDVDRMIAVHDVGREELDRIGQSEMHLTADTNEMCESPQYIVEMLQRIRQRSPETFERTLYIEQPTGRDLDEAGWDMTPIAALKPVIVDESLTTLESFDRAMELGWSGVALKTCKGHSSDMLFVAKAAKRRIPYAVQDLTNPSLALIHSVGLGARINTIMGVEANSRQFFPDSTPEAERRVHEGIFRLEGGEADTSSLQGTGLGYQMDRIISGD
ncbi:MAG: mandelate racemase/muconate lactonizing enzyme family protein [candidate division WS1 bacterium]|nr:mandelate racemase/muconate lactonizing enzyme family protein [candidate division WS1 bacterium]